MNQEKTAKAIAAIIVISYFIGSLSIIVSYKGVIFDEYWYVAAAKGFINNKTYERAEHPPLAQLLIAINIILLGDQPLGWRLFSLIFGVISLISFYFFTKRISKDRYVALTVMAVLSIEKMFFTFSSLAVLDIYYISFFLISILTFLQKKFFLSSLLLALSLNCKLVAILGIPIFIMIYFYDKKNNETARSLKNIFFWLFSTVLFFFFFLEIFDRFFLTEFQGPLISFHHLKYMIMVHTSKNWDTTVGDPPWYWLIWPQNYYLGDLALINVKPIENSNPLIIGLGLITLPYSLIRFKKSRAFGDLIILIWIVFFYLLWFPIYFLFSRPIFNFYVLPSIPMICFSNTLFFEKGIHRLLYALINVGIFILFQYPFRIFGII